MNITITGATGFIGRRLARSLAADGHTLRALGRGPVEEFRAVDAVVHLAGEPVAQRWTAKAKRGIEESRRAGTRNLVDALSRAETKPEVLVCASAVGVYGDRGEEILTEASAPGAGFLADVCVGWEAEADCAAALGIRVVKLRIGVVLGPEGGALKRMLPPFKLGVGGPLGSGRQWMSWIQVDDLVRLIRFALEDRGASGVLNAVAPEPVRNADFSRALGRALHRPAFLPTPAFAIRALFGEMAQILLASQRVIPERTRAAGFRFSHPDLAEALEAVARLA